VAVGRQLGKLSPAKAHSRSLLVRGVGKGYRAGKARKQGVSAGPRSERRWRQECARRAKIAGHLPNWHSCPGPQSTKNLGKITGLSSRIGCELGKLQGGENRRSSATALSPPTGSISRPVISSASSARKRGLEVAQQQPVRVHYDDVVVGDYLADLLVEWDIIIELKATRASRCLYGSVSELSHGDRFAGLLAAELRQAPARDQAVRPS
jgi:hypothetical protein